MTDLSYLLTEANLISSSSSRIRKFAQDAAKELAALEARVAAAEAKATTPPTTPPAVTPVPVGALLLQEDFTGPLAPTKWDVKSRKGGSGTVFDASHVGVSNGGLNTWADKDSAGVWHSAEIQGLAPAYQYRGRRYMEVLAKLPGGLGTWSAPLWEWGAPWGANAVEIDLCEMLGKDPLGQYHVTLHEGLSGKECGKVIKTGVDLTADLHLYADAVYDDRVDWYFDGQHFDTTTKDECFAAGFTTWPFTTTDMVCLSDLDMGGWGGPISVAAPVNMRTEKIRILALA